MNRLMVVLLGISVTACGQQKQAAPAPPPTPPEVAALNQPLPKSPDLAERELLRRLKTFVSVQSGIVTAHDTFSGQTSTYFLPANTLWTMKCGSEGLSIIFGTSASRDENGARNDVDVELSFASIEKSDCSVIGVALAGEVRTMLSGSDHNQ